MEGSREGQQLQAFISFITEAGAPEIGLALTNSLNHSKHFPISIKFAQW